VLRITDETLEAFFQLPIPMHPAVLPDLIIGLDKYLQYYVSKAKSGCGKFAHDWDIYFLYGGRSLKLLISHILHIII